MNERLLPIGTVVLLKEAKKNIMITSYFVFSTTKDDGIFDYGGCPYPLGIVDANSTFAFNHEDIEKVIHLGYIDEDQKKLSKSLIDNEAEIKQKIKEELSKQDKKEA